MATSASATPSEAELPSFSGWSVKADESTLRTATSVASSRPASVAVRVTPSENVTGGVLAELRQAGAQRRPQWRSPNRQAKRPPGLEGFCASMARPGLEPAAPRFSVAAQTVSVSLPDDFAEAARCCSRD